ncbi:MAG TPA: sulfur carrier protein ThiS [Sandaracinaceae bacterium]
MRIEVNGEPREVAPGTTIAALLEQLGLGGVLVAVERNQDVVPRAEHARTTIADGDRLEIVQFVGGG